MTPRQYREDYLTNSRVHEMTQKVSAVEDGSLNAHRRENPRHVPSIVRITTTDGEEYETRVGYPSGHPERPISDAEIEGKSGRCLRSI
ncbi:hypothetical protein C2R22_24350 (plasmid) [Salinigranum rubrum]|uniref:MmgE/PrpD C-terminal domain-containing protein n=1 Tax=Salinigranum rubrum TaxID=755307 RepID=A0A2I8VRW0_9EURY|nr:hypothetical protein C2R22_24350 [Salinigranum rubrum]